MASTEAIACDEGRLIGVLTGPGGITFLVDESLRAAAKDTGTCVLYDEDPMRLVRRLVDGASMP